MTDAQIETRARAAGLMVEWTDFTGQMRRVPIDTLRHLLDAIGGSDAAAPPPPEMAPPVRGYDPDPQSWGLAVQIYSLRRAGDGGIGDTGALSALVDALAPRGADALALSPTHALYAAEPCHYSPYAPSSRLFLNPLLADPASVFGSERVAAARQKLEAKFRQAEAAALIDWPESAAAKYGLLRRLFDGFMDDALRAELDRFRAAGGRRLENHARFEAIYTAYRSAWHKWPADLRDPAGAAVADFAGSHPDEVAYHVFLQWIAERSFAAVQDRALGAGMRIGLISDLAVGANGGGSEVWSMQDDYLTGVTIGAPPDALGPLGQNWGLTALSPRSLRETRLEAYRALLCAALKNAGGVRIDHVMGLQRLWLIPEGADADQGAYLTYPFRALAGLIAQESAERGAVVIGEDLGTLPDGFRDEIRNFGIHGLEVLWFQRAADRFLAPGDWSERAVAMTSTHDLPTLAGWWRGRDIAARRKCHQISALGALDALKGRKAGRAALWHAFTAADAATGQKPAAGQPARVAQAGIAFLARTPSRLALLPMEDLLLLEEQPNLPGTVTGHPNWRRRYPQIAWDDPHLAGRIDLLRRRSRVA